MILRIFASYSSSASVSVWWCTGREAALGCTQLTPWRRPQWPHPPRASQTFSCNLELLNHTCRIIQDHTFYCFSRTKTDPAGYNPSFFIGTAKLDPSMPVSIDEVVWQLKWAQCESGRKGRDSFSLSLSIHWNWHSTLFPFWEVWANNKTAKITK